ncbi:MAG: hypothetical protein ACRDPW_03665 [Mycobacteriales bacterium]
MNKEEKVTFPEEAVVEVSDYDPDRGDELLYARDGRAITNELLGEWRREIESDDTLIDYATSVIHLRRGRPSLTSPGVQSPQVRFRVPARVREKADLAAAQEGKTVSQLAREVLENYLDARAA